MMYIPNPPEPTRVHFSYGVVNISDGWATFSGRHYKLADINRIEIARIYTNMLPLWVFIYTCAIALVLLAVAFISFDSARFDPIYGYKSLDTPFMGIEAFVSIYLIGTWFVLAVLAWRWRTSHRVYLLRLKGEFGRVNALASMDEGYVKLVARALQKAVRDEGWI